MPTSLARASAAASQPRTASHPWQLRCNAALCQLSGTHVGSSESHSSTGGCTGGVRTSAADRWCNVACDHAGHFDWRRLVVCVNQFVNRGVAGVGCRGDLPRVFGTVTTPGC